MAATSRREALRGAEAQILDLIFDALTSEQWAKLLEAPLELTAAKGHTVLASKLICAGASVGNALHEAVRGGHGEVVNDLLGHGASVADANADGCIPLHVAAHHGQAEMVQLLLLKGAEKDEFDFEGLTPLYHAARHGHVAAALALLAAGADASLECGEGNAAPVMHVAASEGHAEVLGALIEQGADVHAVSHPKNAMALHEAAAFGRVEAVDLLVRAGANIEARDRDGETPLICASRFLDRASVACLLKHGAKVDVQSDALHTPLMYAAFEADECGAAEVVDVLLRAGADDTLRDSFGWMATDLIPDGVLAGNMSGDVERVFELLANAPADRAWRRRGYLVLCRAYPDRVAQNQLVRGTHRSETGRRTDNLAGLARAGRAMGDCTVDGSTGGEWTTVAAKVLRLQEEGIFRTIMGYL
eukprot:g6867.t1